MKITEKDLEVVSIRKSIRYFFTIENENGDSKEIYCDWWMVDSDDLTEDGETWYTEDDDQDIDWDEIQEWLGENDDVDDLRDNLSDLISELNEKENQ